MKLFSGSPYGLGFLVYQRVVLGGERLHTVKNDQHDWDRKNSGDVGEEDQHFIILPVLAASPSALRHG